MTQRFGPMQGGLDLDIEGGDPSELRELHRFAEREELKHRRLERNTRLVADLAGNGGEVVKAVADKLARRIEELIAQDAAATAYLDLLKDISRDLRVGDRIAQDEMHEVLRQEMVRE